MKRFRYKQFACVRAVCVSRVDQVDAQIDCASENFEGILPVRRPPPNPFTGNAHCPKAESIDCEIAA